MPDGLRTFVGRVGHAFRAFAKLAWEAITFEPPIPSWADVFASGWQQGAVVPDILQFTVMDPASGLEFQRYPVLLGYAPSRGDSFVFRLRAWPRQQTAQQIVDAVPMIESAMQHRIWDVRPVDGDVNAVDIFAGTPPSFERLLVAEQMRLCYPSDSDWRVYMGWDVFGEPVYLAPHNKSALLLTGEPGSGKSVLLLRLLRSWKQSGAIIRVADFKRSGDFDELGTDDVPVLGDDLDAAISMLEKAKAVIDTRVSEMAELGQSNYWKYPPNGRPPLYVITIDEVQELLETNGVEKERKQRADRASSLLRSLIKLGRSAGIFVVLGTQKSDTSAIPSSLRDQMGIRISGRQTTLEGSKAALGSLPDDAHRPDNPNVIPPDAPGRMVMVGQKMPIVFQSAG